MPFHSSTLLSPSLTSVRGVTLTPRRPLPHVLSFPMDTLDATRQSYAAPTLSDLGSVARLTMGNNGSSLDGNCTFTQRGFGNNNEDGNDRGNGNGNGNGNNCETP